MSYLVAGPDSLTAAASDLAEIGSAISGATDAASAATTGLLPAAADEVSTQIAEFFASHADQYRAVSAQAAAFHSAFVRAVEAGAAWYASTEAANAAPLRQLVGAVNASAATTLGPLVSTSASGSEIALIMG